MLSAVRTSKKILKNGGEKMNETAQSLEAVTHTHTHTHYVY